jgi:hypothetical protein
VRFTFGQTAEFFKRWKRLKLTDEDQQALEKLLAEHPEAGMVMQGTGGLRKVRFAPPSWHAGKSGAARVCYVIYTDLGYCYLVTLFPKNQKANLSGQDKERIRKLIPALRQLVERLH